MLIGEQSLELFHVLFVVGFASCFSFLALGTGLGGGAGSNSTKATDSHSLGLSSSILGTEGIGPDLEYISTSF